MSKRIASLSVCALALSLVLPNLSAAQDRGSHAVFVMNNSAQRNEILSYQRTDDGGLRQVGAFATGGRGSGGNNDPLESQGSLRLSQDGSLLFAVNAGSGELSLFRVHGAQLEFVQKVHVDGSEPVAVAQHGNLVYVLNAGGSSAVVGFAFSQDGLREIPNSRRFLSTNTSGPGALAFSPDGSFLVVTEKSTNNLDVFSVQADGTLSAITINQDSDPGAFAVSFAPNGALLVAETGGAAGSTVSSWAVQANGTLSPISTGVFTLGKANCWNAVTPDGKFLYDSNAGSSDIAGFEIGANGALTALPTGTIAGSNVNGATNLDITVSADGQFLYSLNSKNGTIGIFAIQSNGSLNYIGAATGITPNVGFNGIAAN